MSLSSCWVPAGWARYIARGTHASIASLRSRFCPPHSPRTVSGCTASSRKHARPLPSTTPISLPSTNSDRTVPCHYIAMELVEGKTLRELLASGLLPMRKAIEIAAQIADGLTKAHEAGITHRDLKPENLMVSHDGFVKILDFGLAKLASSGERLIGYAQLVHLADSSRSGSRNGGIHVTGAGQRGWAGFPVRPVLVRLGALRDGDRKARLSEKHGSGDTCGHSP